MLLLFLDSTLPTLGTGLGLPSVEHASGCSDAAKRERALLLKGSGFLGVSGEWEKSTGLGSYTFDVRPWAS